MSKIDTKFLKKEFSIDKGIKKTHPLRCENYSPKYYYFQTMYNSGNYFSDITLIYPESCEFKRT